jgi:hypothetical protein
MGPLHTPVKTKVPIPADQSAHRDHARGARRGPEPCNHSRFEALTAREVGCGGGIVNVIHAHAHQHGDARPDLSKINNGTFTNSPAERRHLHHPGGAPMVWPWQSPRNSMCTKQLARGSGAGG